jgi:glycosyltransferase involved in cell wall biosynthesis
VGGVPEVVSHGVTGWLTPPGDQRALSQKLIALALDSNLRAQMGEAGRTRVEAEFSLTRLADSSADFYYQVIAESRFRFQDAT